MLMMIDKDKLLKAIQAEQQACKTGFPKRSFRLNDAINLIKDFPAVDVVDADLHEQVKCKDCKNLAYWDDCVPYCPVIDISVNPDDYCSHGERKKK